MSTRPDQPEDNQAEGKLPPGLDPAITKRLTTIEVETKNLRNMQHEASVDGFTFRSDEPPTLRGDDEYPYPLHYLVAAIGF